MSVVGAFKTHVQAGANQLQLSLWLNASFASIETGKFFLETLREVSFKGLLYEVSVSIAALIQQWVVFFNGRRFLLRVRVFATFLKIKIKLSLRLMVQDDMTKSAQLVIIWRVNLKPICIVV